jgi:hypothetical protein
MGSSVGVLTITVGAERIVAVLRRWRSDWNLSIFLGVLIATVFVVHPLAELALVSRGLLEVFFMLVLAAGILAAGRRIGMGFAAAIMGTAAMVAVSAHLVSPSDASRTWLALAAIASLSLFAFAVLSQTMRQGPITAHRIQGAIAVYLLLGLIWAYAYLLVEFHFPGAFAVSSTRPPEHWAPTLIYFSFSTLTTAGYGDVAPVNPLARLLANVEGLVGQLFPAILIARLVAMELQWRTIGPRSSDRGAGAAEPRRGPGGERSD